MTYTIKSVEDLISLWPDDARVEYSSSEIHTACPFCPPDTGDVYERDGRTFVGDNRFVIFSNHAWCRDSQYHDKTVPKWISFEYLAKFLGSDISPDFSTSSENFKPIVRQLETYTDTTIADAHANVFRKFWKKYGWTDATINRFKLGMYDMFMNTSFHIVPYKATDTETDEVTGWVMEGRAPDEEGKSQTRRSVGLTQNYVFFIHENKDDRSIIITEGVKDGITAYQLGFRNILSISGATIWQKEKSAFLARHGFELALIVGDNDEAGKAFNQDVIDRNAASGIKTSQLVWDDEMRLKYDITNLLEDLGEIDALEYIAAHTQSGRPQKPVWSSLEPRKVDGQLDQDYIEVEEIRGTGERSIQYNLSTFIGEYKKKSTRGFGALLLLNASPGTGKTHTLVRTIEPIAQKRREQVELHKDNLLSEIARLQQEISEVPENEDTEANKSTLNSLLRSVNDLSYSSVLWFAKFRKSTQDLMELAQDSSLWFDYEGRHPDNCGNFGITQELGQKNHDIRSYCETACPLRDACRENGYLSQDEKMKKKSITIVRHQNLVNEGLIKQHKDLVVVDESPLDVIESPMEIERRTLHPVTPTWYMQLANDPEFPAVKSATLFVDGIRHMMDNCGDKEEISGSALFKKLDEFIVSHSDGAYDLVKVMENLDQRVFDDYYQPTYLVSGVTEIYYRTVPFIYKALSREYLWYKSNPDADTDVSQVTISRTRFTQTPILSLLRMQTPKIRASTPVVVADATTREPELYQIGFDRRVEVYAPESRNPNLVEHVFYGRDFTATYRIKKFGALIRDKKSRVERQAKNIHGEILNLDDIEMTDNVYDDNYVANDYFDMITYVAARNESCLVVTHKDMQDLLEEPFRTKYPTLQERIKWGHFGALRGDNHYKDLKSAVIFGVPRIPYDVIARRARAWSAVGGRMEKIGKEMIYKTAPYGNHELGNEHITFLNPFAEKLVDIQEKGEIQQATERIRPHVTKEVKHVYYCMTRPMDAKNVSDVRPFYQVMREWRTEQKTEDAANYILDTILKTGKRPTINEVRRVSHLQYDDAKQAFLIVADRNREIFSGAK